jgi:hypothetical protein
MTIRSGSGRLSPAAYPADSDGGSGGFAAVITWFAAVLFGLYMLAVCMAIVRYRAMPFQWPPWHPNLWRMVGWGILLASGHGSLETHKKMDLLRERSSPRSRTLLAPQSVRERRCS